MEKSKEKSDEISIKLGYSFFDLLKYFELLESFVFYPKSRKETLASFRFGKFCSRKRRFRFHFPRSGNGIVGSRSLGKLVWGEELAMRRHVSSANFCLHRFPPHFFPAILIKLLFLTPLFFTKFNKNIYVY